MFYIIFVILSEIIIFPRYPSFPPFFLPSSSSFPFPAFRFELPGAPALMAGLAAKVPGAKHASVPGAARSAANGAGERWCATAANRTRGERALHGSGKRIVAAGIENDEPQLLGRLDREQHAVERWALRRFRLVERMAQPEHVRGKPEPDVFIEAARRAGFAPQDCIVFEDAPLGVEAARRAGMRAVVLTTTLPAEAFAEFDNVIHIVSDFSELTFDELFNI